MRLNLAKISIAAWLCLVGGILGAYIHGYIVHRSMVDNTLPPSAPGAVGIGFTLAKVRRIYALVGYLGLVLLAIAVA